MSELTAAELRAYLKKRARESDSIAEFDEFIEQAQKLFALRVAAEKNFKQNPHLAHSKRRELPLTWAAIREVLSATETPPETTVTQIARECLTEIEEISVDLRKVLVRKRSKVSLGAAQQIDSSCLRWLTRQPGRDVIEKAGVRQQILAVVRNENFNTLENRIFKDFLIRAGNFARQYERRHKEKFAHHDLFKKVVRLTRLCHESLQSPLLDSVAGITELPAPNYVLQQERRYAKIWVAYCRLVKQAEIIEKLWTRRDELAGLFEELESGVPLHCDPRAKYHAPMWFNYIDGKNEFLDQAFFHNELADSPITEADAGDVAPEVILDLTGRPPVSDLLIYGKHSNAKPYLQNFSRPSIEDWNDGANAHFLTDILRQRDAQKLPGYFEQLRPLVQGEHWYILTPDDWDAEWQEKIIHAAPMTRDKIFLLWRSVAAIIGMTGKLNNAQENDIVAVVDFQLGGKINISKLTLAREESGALVPRRQAKRHHPEKYAVIDGVGTPNLSRESFLIGKRANQFPREKIDTIHRHLVGTKHAVFVGDFGADKNALQALFTEAHFVDAKTLADGTRIFIGKHQRKQVAYFDELEELAIVVQTKDEQVRANVLVKNDSEFIGGTEYVGDENSDLQIRRGENFIDCYLRLGGEKATLFHLRHDLDFAPEQNQTLALRAKMTPGQGLAVVTVTAPFLRQPLTLDLQKMQETEKTLEYFERDMERSFPPDSPDVIADNEIWQSVITDVKEYVEGQISPAGNWFAKAADVYDDFQNPLPAGESPLEKLRRKNVFGNDPQKRLPEAARNGVDLFGKQIVGFDFSRLFKKLADDFASSANGSNLRNEVIRLIAWTYQFDNPLFDRARQITLQRIADYAAKKIKSAPKPQEYTLCANLCNRPDEWEKCLNAIFQRISDYNNSVSEDLRLLYNLLQFHPALLQVTQAYADDKCWNLMKHLPYWYEQHRNSSKLIGYVLKSMLYLLRCRRFDGKLFLTAAHDNEHYQIIRDCLQRSVWRTKEPLRQTVLKYLEGKGTIDGLPTD